MKAESKTKSKIELLKERTVKIKIPSELGIVQLKPQISRNNFQVFIWRIY